MSCAIRAADIPFAGSNSASACVRDRILAQPINSFYFRLLPGSLEAELHYFSPTTSASGSLRTPSVHDTGAAQEIRSQDSRRAREIIESSEGCQTIALGHGLRRPADSGKRRWRCRSGRAGGARPGCRAEQLLPSEFDGSLHMRSDRRPPSRHRAAGIGGGAEASVPNDLYLNSTTHSVLVLTGPKWAANPLNLDRQRLNVSWRRWDHLSGGLGAARRGGPRVHPHRSKRQLGAWALDLHGGDDGNRSPFCTRRPRGLRFCWMKWFARTSTYDGLAIAWAAVEYIHGRTRAKRSSRRIISS